jgi:hypothetical protein
MADEELIFPAFAEWEALREPFGPLRVLGQPVLESQHLPFWVDKLKVSRVENHDIEAVFEGPAPLVPNRAFPRPPNPVTIAFTDPADARLAITGSIPRFETRSASGSEGKPFQIIRAYMRVQEFLVLDRVETETTRLTDWFLNGPKLQEVYSERTEREIYVQRKRRRSGLRSGIDTIQHDGPWRASYAHDFVRIRYDRNAFVLHAVPKDAGVPWSNCVGIEFRKDWGGIPTREVREKIADLAGFVVGRRLLFIGHTEFGNDGVYTARSAVPPNTTQAETISRIPDRPPIQIVRNTGTSIRSSLKPVLESLVPVYLSEAGQYDLGGALFRHAIAREVPLGMDLSLLQAAIEMVGKGWRRAQKQLGLADPGCYMRKSDFENLFGEQLDEMAAKLSSRESKKLLIRRQYRERLLGKARRSYQMTANELLDMFYEGIRVPRGEPELKAIKARNASTHGSTVAPEEAAQWAAHSDAYYTLANRVILRILGYRGRYFDYTSGVERPLSQPTSGPQPAPERE